MKDLTADRLRELFSYDQETGVFTRNKKASSRLAGSVSGYIHKTLGYVQIGIDYKIYYGHRLAILYVSGDWPTDEVDHINGIRSDNRLCNLRCVDRIVNQQNARSARSDSASGLIGVGFDKRRGCYRAEIKTKEGRRKYLGTFSTPEQASDAYITAKRILHEGCTL